MGVMKYQEAKTIADNLVALLAPHCERIEIAGSLRRLKPEVGDIEIVCISKTEKFRDDLFGGSDEMLSLLHFLKFKFEAETGASKIKGKEKLFKFALPQGINLDVFIVTPPAHWGVIYTIRTGPAEFSHWCVTNSPIGCLPYGYKVQGGCVYREMATSEDTPIPMAEESDFLNFLGLGWIEPKDRKPGWGRKAA